MRILLGQHGSNGDCLYATIIARQIKSDHPSCRLTWAVASKCSHLLANNPYVDEVWEWPIKEWPDLENAWYEFERRIKDDQIIRESYDEIILPQVWPNNFRNFDGTVRPSILRAYDVEYTVPIDSVIELDETEKLNVKKFVDENNIDKYRHKILFECSSKSGQSYVTPSFALEVANIVSKKIPDCCFIITTHEEIRSDQTNIISASPVSFRENLALIEYCSMFVGCGSGLTVISTSSSAKNIPNIQILSKNKSMLGSFHHDFEYFGKDASRFIEMSDVDPSQVAHAICSVCNEGLVNASEQYHKPIPLTFNFYLETIRDWLVKREHYVDALQSLSVTMQRYGHVNDLVDFGSKYVLPNLQKDKNWGSHEIKQRAEKLNSFFSSTVDWLPRNSVQDYNHCTNIIEITKWGGELCPIRFEREPCFKNDAYSQLIEQEFEEIDLLIRVKNVSKIGDKFVQSIKAPSLKLFALRVNNLSGDDRVVEWKRRYPLANQCIHHRVGRILAKLSKNSFKKIRKIIKRIKKVGYRVQGNGFIKKSLNKIGLRTNEHLNVRIADEKSLSADISEKLKHFTSIVYIGESYVIPSLFKELAKSLSISSEIIRCDLAPIDISDRTAMFLRKPSLLYRWLSGMYRVENYIPLIIVDVEDTEALFKSLEGKLKSDQAFIVNLRGKKILRNEFEMEWGNAEYIAENVLYLYGPTDKYILKPLPVFDVIEWPKISVVTVSYNQGNFIERCIASIVNQGYPNLEYIIIDGGSTDDTLNVIDKYKDVIDIVISEPDNGQSDALNKGFKLATGEILTWVCSDDALEPNSLYHAGSNFINYDVDIIAGECRIVDENDRVINFHYNALPYNEVMRLSFGDLVSFCSIWHKGMYFYQPEVFFSKNIWQKSGAYLKEHLYYAMDYDLFLRFAIAGAKIIHIPHVLGVTRKHESQKTQDISMEYLPTIRSILAEYKEIVDESNKFIVDSE